MTFNFDRVIERRGTDSSKWGRVAGPDILPLPVADMDFPSPPAVIEAISRRAAHGIFGYAYPTREAIDAVVDLHRREQGWSIDPDWIVWLPGLEVGVNVMCRACDGTDDPVATATPIYPPFLSAPLNMYRKRVTVPLARDPAGRYVFDFDLLERDLAASRSRLFLLCSPHNPVGRVWTRGELEQLAAICLRHQVTVCADEVHSGLILDADRPFIPFATLSPEVAASTITLMAPSKTYNLAGLACAYAIISDSALRTRFRRAARGLVTDLNIFGYTACVAAYREGQPWRAALLDYLRGNRDVVERAVDALPGLSMAHVEATYLAWIDCRDAGLEDPAAFFTRAGVGLSDGVLFGAPGFVRLNFGCPRATLDEGLRRIRQAMRLR